MAALLLGSHLLGGTASGSDFQPPPAAATTSSSTADDLDDLDDGCTGDACGNEHSRAIHAWVTCKADKGKDACTKPVPPGGRARPWSRPRPRTRPLKAKDKTADDEVEKP